jgi:hypothetical protein
MSRTTTIPIYLFILNGLYISREEQYYDIPSHVDDIVVINDNVDKTLNDMYQSIVLNNQLENNKILDIFDKIILEPKRDMIKNELDQLQMKLPTYIFYPELYRHQYQLIMGVYKSTIQIQLNPSFSYKYKSIEKLFTNEELNKDSYTYSYLLNNTIKKHKEKCFVGFFISNLNEPLTDKINPTYKMINNIEFLGPNEVNHNIKPFTFHYQHKQLNHMLWNGNIAQYHIGCALSTLLYYKLISYEFAINELSKISKNGTSIWRLLEYCIFNDKIKTPLCVCRFPIKIGYLFLCDFLLKSKINKLYVIFRTCNHKNEEDISNEHGHTASLIIINKELYNIDPYLNLIEPITSLTNIDKIYDKFGHTHIDIPFEINEKGISLKQLKQLKGFIRARLPLFKMRFGGK